MRLGDDRDLGRDEPDALIGTQIGPLTLVRRLTEGGMGSVYLAEHAELHTQQAVKVLSPHITQNEVLVRRFVNEVRGAALLRHRNLLRAHEIGRLPNGSWFMVFDYVDGQSLGRFIRSHTGPIPLPIVVHVVSEIANGLHAAHAHKIVHRDLKPDNALMVALEGDPHHMVVLDLGVAMLGDDPWSAPRARSGVVIGTPAYMSAEQLRGDQVTAASDIFALGVIAYQMSTGGWFPYQHGESRTGYCELAATELYHRQMTEPAIDPRKHCSRLGSAWASALLAAVSADLDVRPARRARARAQPGRRADQHRTDRRPRDRAQLRARADRRRRGRRSGPRAPACARFRPTTWHRATSSAPSSAPAGWPRCSPGR